MDKKEFLKRVKNISESNFDPDAWKETPEIKEQFELIRQAEEKLKNG